MNITELKNSIYYEVMPHFLIFYGDETYVKKAYFEKISPIWNTVDSLNDLSYSKNLIIKKPTYYKIDGRLLLEESKDNWESLKNKFLYSFNYFIFNFYDDSFKKNKDFVSTFKDYIIEFDFLSERLLLNRFSKQYLVSDDNLLKIIRNCNNDYISIESELNKIKCYAEEKKISEDIAYSELLKRNLLYIPIGDCLFDFLNAISSKDLNNINFMLYLIKQTPEPVLGIIKGLYKQFDVLYKVIEIDTIKDQEEKQHLFDSFKLSKGRLFYLRQQIRAFGSKNVIKNMKFLQNVEYELKVGKLDQENALDYIVLELLANEKD